MTFANPLNAAKPITITPGDRADERRRSQHVRAPDFNSRHGQRGVVLVVSILLLLVMTILAISMFRSYGSEEKIAGNTRDKERAFNAAVSAQQFAEYWLSSNSAPVWGGLHRGGDLQHRPGVHQSDSEPEHPAVGRGRHLLRSSPRPR